MKAKLNLLLPTQIFTTLALLLFPQMVNAAIQYKFESFITPTSIEGLLVAILQILVTIAVPIVVLFIIYSGFLYVTAKGNAEQIRKATTALTYAVIGGVLIIGAVAISEVIKNVVTAFSAP
jgi:Type IV secretion system pilin